MAFRRARIAVSALAFGLLAVSNPGLAQDYDELSPEQKELLAPLAEYWDRIPPPRRERLLEMAERVANGTPGEQDRFRRGLHRFLSLDAEQRHQVRELFERFRHLPPDERQRIIERVSTMPESERRAFALGMRVADRTRRMEDRIGGHVEEYLRSLPPEERRELLSDLRELSGPQKLRRLADAIEADQARPDAQRD